MGLGGCKVNGGDGSRVEFESGDGGTTSIVELVCVLVDLLFQEGLRGIEQPKVPQLVTGKDKRLVRRRMEAHCIYPLRCDLDPGRFYTLP